MKREKPTDVVAIGTKINYVDTETTPPPPEDDYKVHLPKGKTAFELPFTEDKIGKQVWRRKKF